MFNAFIKRNRLATASGVSTPLFTKPRSRLSLFVRRNLWANILLNVALDLNLGVDRRRGADHFRLALACHIVAFCCKGRGFCPSCGGRRMNEAAANLVDHVLPYAVPLRRWVLTLPFPLRFPLAFDPRLLGAVLRIFTDTVATWYRKSAEGDCGSADAQCKSKYIPWHELLRRTFNVDDTCAHCKGQLRLIALIKTQATIIKILATMGLPTVPPAAVPARAPPCFSDDVCTN